MIGEPTTKIKRQMTNNQLIGHFLIGLPGSGKSTFAHRLKEMVADAVVVSTDRVRQRLYGDESIQGNWAEIEQEVVRQIQLAIASRKPVIYDATNVRRDWRIDMLTRIEAGLTIDQPEVYWVAWHLQTPIDLCKQWNQKRDRQVPDEVIDQYAELLNQFPPDKEEGFMQIYQVRETPPCNDGASSDFVIIPQESTINKFYYKIKQKVKN